VTPSQGIFLSPTWTVGSLATGSSATLTVVLTATSAASPGTDVICDTATLTAVDEPQVSTGDESDTECTSIAVAADLSITKEDDADPPPAGSDLTYTLTVHNDGPSNATNVVVTDPLPAGVSYVSDDCGGSNVPPWTWNLGSLATGATAVCHLVVSIDPMPPASVSNTATVTSDVFDDDTSNNSDTETTTLDAEPPTVTNVDTTAPTPGGSLEECETANVEVSAIHVTFSEAMYDPPGDTATGDVTNPASYQLVRPGADLEFDTAMCGGAAGDDVAVPLAAGSVTYASGTDTATIALGAPLPDSLYRLFACGTLRDPAGNQLDGVPGVPPGDDFVRGFRVDAHNLFANGHFDCDLGGWVVSPPGTFVHDTADADGSPESGSALADVTALPAQMPDAALGQCVGVSGGAQLDMSARYRVTVLQSPDRVSVSLRCQFFGSASCTSPLPGPPRVNSIVVIGPGTTWHPLALTAPAPAGAHSALCTLEFDTHPGVTFEGAFDRALLIGPGGGLFSDGFESGDATVWSTAVGN
jgi:uncharacterized repeat protein (TIGR01451 family)